jgi:hypothetical protein
MGTAAASEFYQVGDHYVVTITPPSLLDNTERGMEGQRKESDLSALDELMSTVLYSIECRPESRFPHTETLAPTSGVAHRQSLS